MKGALEKQASTKAAIASTAQEERNLKARSSFLVAKLATSLVIFMRPKSQWESKSQKSTNWLRFFLRFQGQFLKAEKRPHRNGENSSFAFWCIKMYVSISARNQATNRIKGGVISTTLWKIKKMYVIKVREFMVQL